MKKIIASMVFAVSAMILVSGCSSSDSTPAPSTLTGTAATGAPIDGTVFVKDAKGVEKSIATAADGSFTLDVPDMTPPYLLKIMPSTGPELYSYASQNGQTVNLTPATNLAMFLAYGKQDLNTLYVAWDGSGVTASAVKTAEGTVRANIDTQLTAVGLDTASFDLFTSAFTANSTGFDLVLDNMVATVDPGAGTFTFDADKTDSGTPGFVEGATPPTPPAPPAPANAISIATVSGSTHQLNGTYYTACYNPNSSADGEIDSVTITGTAWVNRQDVYTGDANCLNSVSKTGAIIATITKGVDEAITGWEASQGGAPQRADGTGSISNTEIVTKFNLVVNAINDPDGILGFTPPSPLPYDAGNAFYVFDDTGSGFAMYRDRDGFIAGKSDPFIRR